MPTSENLENTRQQYLDLDRGGYLTKRPYLTYTDDEIFKRLALVIRNRCAEEKPKKEDLTYLFHHCELYLTQILSAQSSDCKKALSLFKPDFKLGNSLRKELMREKRTKNYRQIIVTFSPYVCKAGDECTRQFIRSINFKIKDNKEYNYFSDFKKDCQIFLEQYLLEPLIAPCMITENRLNLLGFELKEPDI